MDLPGLALDELTVPALWSALDPATRRLAAQTMYEESEDRREDSAEADAAIAAALRFRLVAVRRMPVAKRVDYLTRVVRPDESLASKLLRALHLTRRRDLLAGFLDGLSIPHEHGVIDPEFDFEADRPDAARLAAALEPLYERFPSEQVDLYAVTLLALDPDCWGPMAEVLERRVAATSASGKGRSAR